MPYVSRRNKEPSSYGSLLNEMPMANGIVDGRSLFSVIKMFQDVLSISSSLSESAGIEIFVGSAIIVVVLSIVDIQW